MSEHTKGKLSGDKYGRIYSEDDNGLFIPAGVVLGEDACRIAAAWNFCEDMKTETMEQAKKTAFAYMTDSDQHAHKLAQELNAARALLRDVAFVDVNDTLELMSLRERATSYLDACDTLGMK